MTSHPDPVTLRASSLSPGTDPFKETCKDSKGVCVKNRTLSPRSVAAVTAARNNTHLLLSLSPCTTVLLSASGGNLTSLVTGPDANRLKTTSKISAMIVYTNTATSMNIFVDFNVNITHPQRHAEVSSPAIYDSSRPFYDI